MRIAWPLLAALALGAPLQAAAEQPCAPDRLSILWPDGQAEFSVEIADDAAERARGLMFRTDMGDDQAMLFVYDAPHPVAFWMKNTEIPLDMLFVGADGRVQTIHPMAVPHDETPIPGGDAVQYVVEINGGLAARLAIPQGAALRHPRIDGLLAAAPCPAP